MKIACIDDMSADGKRILMYIDNHFQKYEKTDCSSYYFSSGDDFFKVWRPGLFNLIILDIFLEKDDGINIAKTIRRVDHNVPIVFCSSSNEFAAESYEVQANYYLTKPVSEEAVRKMLLRLDLLQKDEDIYELPDQRMLALSHFIYSEYHNHLITIHLKDNTTEKIWSSQSDFLESLEAYDYFLAVNPGTIINLKEVVDFIDDSFYMTDGNIVPISKRKRKDLISRYKSYLFTELRRH